MHDLNRFMPPDVEAVLRIYLKDVARPDLVSQEEWLSFLLIDGLSASDAGPLSITDLAETLCRCDRNLVWLLAITHDDRVLDGAIKALWGAFGDAKHFMQMADSPVLALPARPKSLHRPSRQ